MFEKSRTNSSESDYWHTFIDIDGILTKGQRLSLFLESLVNILVDLFVLRTGKLFFS